MAASVTVVVPAYNVGPYVGATLDSLLAQSLADWECFVVDDGSKDDTAAVVETYTDPRITLIRQENAGVSVARNKGLAAATAPGVLFLDGDDMLHPTALARLKVGFDAHPEAVLVFGTSMKVEPDGSIMVGQKPELEHSYAQGDVLRNMIMHQNIFWNGGQVLCRTSAVRAIGGYTPGIRLSQDWEMFCRLTATGQSVWIGPQETILLHRVHPNSTVPRLSPNIDSHMPATNAVFNNPDLKKRFTDREWEGMRAEVLAAHTFEAGRQNFLQRKFDTARKLMWNGIRIKPSKRRVAVFILAQASQLLDRPLVSILRYNVPKETKPS